MRAAKQLSNAEQTLTGRNARSLAGIGDYNCDGRADFALVNPSRIQLFYGGSTAAAGVEITATNGTFANYTVSSALGNVSGSTHHEFLVNSDSGPSFVVQGGPAILLSI